LGKVQARAMLDGLTNFIDRLIDIETLAPRALEIALALGHPVYHCFYLALAEEAEAPLVTADRRLVRRVAGTEWAARVTPLDQFQAP
jgi:predicted nucleic acid-binding protein